MAHTPGPWQIELNNHPREVGDHNYSLFHNGYEFGKYNDESLLCGFSADTPQANARLIAAAPELLEALQTTRTALELSGASQKLLEVVRAAIAKATGK